MNKNFRVFKLGEVAKIVAGGDKPRIFSEYESVNNNIPVFANGEDNNGLLGYTDIPKINEPAVTISARGSKVGFAAVRKQPFFPIVRLLTLIPYRDRLDVNFLYYHLKQSRQSGTGSGQPQITIPDISNRLISIPPVHEQQKIAAVLSALDDKIELNNKINAELEQMARTLYDYWFVQFDFPNEAGKPYKSSGGKMVYNNVLKREIPEGWEVKVFSDWIKETKAGDWGKDIEEGNYTERVYCVRGADINGLNGKGEVKAPQRVILKNNLSKALKPNDFIIEISGGSPTQSTGRIALLTNKTFERFDTDIICSNFCKAISLKDEKYIFNFLQEWKRLYDAGVFFGYEGKTSGIKNFLFDSFINSYKVVLPPKDIVEQYYSIVQSLEEKKQINLQQNQELAQLRDWLLPMLMNGQVKVSDDYDIDGDISGTMLEERNMAV